VDTNPKMMTEVFTAAAKHKGTSIVEILANCVIFNNHIHGLITSRETKDENQIFLEAGKPMIFGKEKDKGLMIKGRKLEVVKLGDNGVTLDDILVHDPYEVDPGIHTMLCDMKPPEYPAALGVIRSVTTETMDAAVWDSIAHEKTTSPYKSVDDLISSGNTWTID
jgi:2-oxoglutarate ferredoxin oxidoreductase subunit beta